MVHLPGCAARTWPCSARRARRRGQGAGRAALPQCACRLALARGRRSRICSRLPSAHHDVNREEREEGRKEQSKEEMGLVDRWGWQANLFVDGNRPATEQPPEALHRDDARLGHLAHLARSAAQPNQENMQRHRRVHRHRHAGGGQGAQHRVLAVLLKQAQRLRASPRGWARATRRQLTADLGRADGCHRFRGFMSHNRVHLRQASTALSRFPPLC